jgi:hypothetical protein
MTESEWLECVEPRPMLDFLNGKGSDRKLRLFACACLRRVCGHWGAWRNGDDPKELIVSERFADDEASRRELLSVRDILGSRGMLVAAIAADEAHCSVLEIDAMDAAHRAERSTRQFFYLRKIPMLGGHMRQIMQNPNWREDFEKSKAKGTLEAEASEQAERGALADLLREIFGNPFRPVVADPAWIAWQNGVIHTMADEIYTQRSYALLPILADALEDAGCTDAALLDHCREPGEHVRGCWALDLVLGKA